MKMDRRQKLDRLVSLRKEIAAFEAVKCRMSHERIILAGGANLEVSHSVSEGRYKRVGLCGAEARAGHLGCGHTLSRYKLEEAIGEMDTGRAGPLAGDLNWLTNEIHLLDHRKGKAEKALALAFEMAGGGEGAVCERDKRIKQAENEVREIELTHDSYVDRISKLRDEVLAEIDKLIGQMSQQELQEENASLSPTLPLIKIPL